MLMLYYSVCDDINLDATQDTTSSLVSFVDSTFATPASTFQVGDWVYFQAIVNSPDASIDQLVLTSVVIAPSQPNEEVVFDVSSSTLISGISFNHTDVTLATTGGVPVPPGTNTIVTFWLRLRRDKLATLSSITSDGMEFGACCVFLLLIFFLYSGRVYRDPYH